MFFFFWILLSYSPCIVGDHPGGEEILLMYAGNDATREYEPVMHSDAAIDKREEMLVGEIEKKDQWGYEELDKKNNRANKKDNNDDMIASVVLVAAAVAGLYFVISNRKKNF